MPSRLPRSAEKGQPPASLFMVHTVSTTVLPEYCSYHRTSLCVFGSARLPLHSSDRVYASYRRHFYRWGIPKMNHLIPPHLTSPHLSSCCLAFDTLHVLCSAVVCDATDRFTGWSPARESWAGTWRQLAAQGATLRSARGSSPTKLSSFRTRRFRAFRHFPPGKTPRVGHGFGQLCRILRSAHTTCTVVGFVLCRLPSAGLVATQHICIPVTPALSGGLAADHGTCKLFRNT